MGPHITYRYFYSHSSAVVGLHASLNTFPANFKLGASTSSYQIEGAWNDTDKSPNVWDELTHKQREKMVDSSDGDVACDSFHLWERDVEMAAEVGLDFYRISISWSRLCPNGFCNVVSESGARYYNQLIDGLLAKGIEPLVTLYHWDLPQRLQNFGGWSNPLIADWFEFYAWQVFTLYADRVKTWITINEPTMVCDGVFSGFLAPDIYDPHFGAYLCNKNVLMAHAKAYKVYDKEFRPRHNGQVSICNHLNWFEPKTPEDADLAELALQHGTGRYSYPIYSKEGGWPPSVEKMIAENSKRQGYTRNRLPAFTKEEKEFIRGTYDYYGMNYYTSRLVHPAKPGEFIGHFPLEGFVEANATFDVSPDWTNTTLEWFKINPKGIRNMMVWLKKQYGDIPIFITENGSPNNGESQDSDRIQFIKDHLKQILLAIEKDAVNVVGYTVWSLMDNFEWRNGYTGKFGLYAVNFTDPNRTRTPRASARFYANVISTRAIEDDSPGSRSSSFPADAKSPITFTTSNNAAPIEKRSNVTWIGIGIVLAVLAVVSVGVICYKRREKSKATEYTDVPQNEGNIRI